MLYIFVPYINIKTYCSYFLNAKSLFALILCSNFMENEYALLHTDSVLMKCLVHLQCYPLLIGISCFHSSQFSHSVVSDSGRSHRQQPARLCCPWGFSRQEYRSGLPCPPPGDLANPGTEPKSPALQTNSLQSESPGKPKHTGAVAYPFSRGSS